MKLESAPAMPLGIVMAVLLLASGCVFDGAGSMTGASDDPGPGGADASTVDPGADAAPVDEPDSAPVGGDDDAGPSCPSYILEASRSYEPESRDDDELNLGSAVSLVIPASLPVTQGNAGDHCAHIYLRRSGDVLYCAYKGASSESTPVPGSPAWADGLRYDFVGCVAGSGGLDACGELDDPSDLKPGDAFETDRLGLSIGDGAYSADDPAAYDPTQVRVEFEEDCIAVDGDGDGDD